MTNIVRKSVQTARSVTVVVLNDPFRFIGKIRSILF